ncbi:MAG TPA: ABC-2 family transporter protein [Chloroflexota bacterium]|nr:ABC-2 family transporter protein [Chloroflexota bacterium]
MFSLFDAYRAQFKITFGVQLQYRVSLLIWLIGTVLQPVMYMVVWSTVAGARGGEVGGFGVSDFAAYFIAVMLIDHATFTWIMHEFEFMVRMGQLSPKLLRPMHPIHEHLADNVTYKLLTFIVLLPVAGLLALVFQPRFEPPEWSLIAFVPSLILAFATRVMLGWTVALAAFWTTRVFAINEMYFLASLFLSGQMAPLSLLPAPIQLLANVLPFRWLVAFPVELVLGRLTPDQALVGFVAQLIWLVLVFSLMSLIWKAGLRRYAAVGA